MDDLVKVAVLDNEIQAGKLESVLEEKDIPHIIRSYYDSVYDGMFQLQKGWGCIEAKESHKEAILAVLDSLTDDAD